jgi:hypothetical protein
MIDTMILLKRHGDDARQGTDTKIRFFRVVHLVKNRVNASNNKRSDQNQIKFGFYTDLYSVEMDEHS